MQSLLLLYLSLFFIQTTSFWSAYGEFVVDGRVIELNDSNIDEAISTFDYILIDFYAPWCGHCKRLTPQLDKAASILAGLDKPIIIAKVDVDKYKSLIKKHNIDGYPTLKIFIHGVPTEYYGPRKFDQLVQHLKKFVVPNVTVLNSDSGVSKFVEEAGNDFPVFIGFDVKESMISNLASKYKKKAWFSVAKDFSEDLMSMFNFDKVPALVALQPTYSEGSIFYGPFEEKFLEDFIKQNLLPLVLPINKDTLELLKGEDRKIALTIVEDETSDNTRDLIKLLKAAASANHDLIFGYVGVEQFEEFVEAFEYTRTQLPKMLIWDGDEEYSFVNGSEWLKEEDRGSQITQFLEGYRKGNVIQKHIGPSFMGFIKSLFGLGTVIAIFFIILLMAVIMIFTKDDEPETVRPQQSASEGTDNVRSQAESGRDKED